HRRDRRGHAQGIFRPLRHPRPLRAAAVSERVDALIAKKALAAHGASIKPIVCVGELLAEREAKQTEKVLKTQVRSSLAGLSKEHREETVSAGDAVGPIGTGKTATAAQAQAAHAFIRKQLASMFDENVARGVRIQYGGSVKPSNAAELMGQP